MTASNSIIRSHLPSNLLYKLHQIPKLKCFSSPLAVVFAQPIEARSQEWRCRYRRCSNHIWVINNFIVYQGATYVRSLMVVLYTTSDYMWSYNNDYSTPIGSQWWNMRCPLGVRHLTSILPFTSLCSMQFHVILDHIIIWVIYIIPVMKMIGLLRWLTAVMIPKLSEAVHRNHLIVKLPAIITNIIYWIIPFALPLSYISIGPYYDGPQMQ